MDGDGKMYSEFSYTGSCMHSACRFMRFTCERCDNMSAPRKRAFICSHHPMAAEVPVIKPAGTPIANRARSYAAEAVRTSRLWELTLEPNYREQCDRDHRQSQATSCLGSSPCCESWCSPSTRVCIAQIFTVISQGRESSDRRLYQEATRHTLQ